MGITDGISTNLIPIVLMTGVENGWVCDVELAKNIILAHFSTMRYYSSPVYRDKSMDDWLEEMDPNEEVLSVCEVDGKPTVFVLHESD